MALTGWEEEEDGEDLIKEVGESALSCSLPTSHVSVWFNLTLYELVGITIDTYYQQTYEILIHL